MSFTNEWLSSLDKIYNKGRIVTPRGLRTKEILGNCITFDMSYPLLEIPERNIGTALLCYEPYWYLSGSDKLSDILPYCPKMEQYSDDGVTLSGAYGPRIVSQVDYVVDTLKNDKESRKAVMTIWDRNPKNSKDHQCTICYQFLIRDEKLHMIVTMRSSDIYTGVPYDCFSQTMIALFICLHLQRKYPKLTLGDLTLYAGSQHLYETDSFNVMEILSVGQEAMLKQKTQLKYNYNMEPEELKEYLLKCAKTLLDKSTIRHGFLYTLEPKNGKR